MVELSDEAIRELHLVRTLLETLAYQRAARLLSPADIERLEELLNRMHEADMAGDRRLVATVDFEFHQTLYRACRLPQVIEMCDRQQVLFRLWLNVVAGAPASRTHRISDVHRSLMDAIKSQDDSAISEQVIHHVYFAGEVLTDQRSEWAKDQPRLVFPSRDKPRSRSVIRRPPALS